MSPPKSTVARGAGVRVGIARDGDTGSAAAKGNSATMDAKTVAKKCINPDINPILPHNARKRVWLAFCDERLRNSDTSKSGHEEK